MVTPQPFFYSLPHFVRHLIRHTVSANIKEKNPINAPEIIVPIMLVVAKVIPKRIKEVNTAPKIAVNKTERTGQMQLFAVTLENLADVIKIIARYTTATPKTTHKNAGVKVITAVVVRTAPIAPKIILTITATTEQLDLQEQKDIFSPPDTVYEITNRGVIKVSTNSFVLCTFFLPKYVKYAKINL